MPQHNRIVKLLAAVCLGAALMTTALAEDTATLTITPDKTEARASGEPVTVTYTFRVSPPPGQEIGVFSIRLLPPEGMQLPDGSRAEQIWVNEELLYSNYNRGGVFRTFEYSPQSRFFAAVGSSPGKRMTAAADVLQVTATIPGGVYGSFTMDAEFIAAPDGSGVSFTPLVQPATVTVTGPGGTSTPPATTPPDAAAPPGTAPGNAVSGTTSPAETPQGDNAVSFGEAPADSSAAQGIAPAEDAMPGGTEANPGLTGPDGDEQALVAPRRSAAWPLWVALALALAVAVAVQCLHPGGWGALLGRRKRDNHSEIEGEGKQ